MFWPIDGEAKVSNGDFGKFTGVFSDFGNYQCLTYGKGELEDH